MIDRSQARYERDLAEAEAGLDALGPMIYRTEARFRATGNLVHLRRLSALRREEAEWQRRRKRATTMIVRRESQRAAMLNTIFAR